MAGFLGAPRQNSHHRFTPQPQNNAVGDDRKWSTCRDLIEVEPVTINGNLMPAIPGICALPINYILLLLLLLFLVQPI